MDVKIEPGSKLKINDGSNITVNDGSKITIKDDSALSILKVQKIAPIATHIKEVNHIDPISIDAFHVNEIKNIEPIRVEKFNITNLPTVNMTVRQLPSVDLNIRRLPAVSIGTHQDFCVPSNYTVRARFLGIEFFRVHLDGQTSIIPQERFRREQGRTQNRSFPVTATAGNPAVPSICRETSTEVCPPVAHHHPINHAQHGMKKQILQNKMDFSYAGKGNGVAEEDSISVRLPDMHFHFPEGSINQTHIESSVNSGE